MATQLRDERVIALEVTTTELATLLVQRAKTANLIPEGFNPTDIEFDRQSEEGKWLLTFREVAASG